MPTYEDRATAACHASVAILDGDAYDILASIPEHMEEGCDEVCLYLEAQELPCDEQTLTFEQLMEAEIFFLELVMVEVEGENGA